MPSQYPNSEQKFDGILFIEVVVTIYVPSWGNRNSFGLSNVQFIKWMYWFRDAISLYRRLKFNCILRKAGSLLFRWWCLVKYLTEIGIVGFICSCDLLCIITNVMEAKCLEWSVDTINLKGFHKIIFSELWWWILNILIYSPKKETLIMDEHKNHLENDQNLNVASNQIHGYPMPTTKTFVQYTWKHSLNYQHRRLKFEARDLYDQYIIIVNTFVTITNLNWCRSDTLVIYPYIFQ